MNICPKCKLDQSPEAKYCRECGTIISPKETINYCEQCGTEYDISNKFCEKDGSTLIPKNQELSNKRDGFEEWRDSYEKPIKNNKDHTIKYCTECGREYNELFTHCDQDGTELLIRKVEQPQSEPVRKGVRKTDNKKLSNRSTNTITPSLFAGAFAYVITNKLIDDEINGWWGVFAGVTVSTLVKILLDQVGVKDQFGDD